MLLGLSLQTAEVVREVADCLASNRDGFFVYKYASSMPNDQAITHRQIRVIRATGTCSDRRSREVRTRSSPCAVGYQRAERLNVRGHEILPVGGHRKSPRASPQLVARSARSECLGSRTARPSRRPVSIEHARTGALKHERGPWVSGRAQAAVRPCVVDRAHVQRPSRKAMMRSGAR